MRLTGNEIFVIAMFLIASFVVETLRMSELCLEVFKLSTKSKNIADSWFTS